MNKSALIFASTLMVISIVLGALGAHAFKDILLEEEMNSFKTATLFLSIQSIALILLEIVQHLAKLSFKNALRLLRLGVCLFSFSIYLLLFLKHSEASAAVKAIGPITPIGGLFMILAWVSVIYTLIKFTKKP